MKSFTLLLVFFLSASLLQAQDEILPTPTQLIEIQNKQNKETQKLIEEGKLRTANGRLVKVNPLKLFDRLVYITDDKRKNFIAVPPQSVLNAGSNTVSWYETRNMNSVSFKSFVSRNKDKMATLTGDSKREDKKTSFIVSADEVNALRKKDLKVALIVVDKKTKMPVSGDVKIE